MGPLSVAITIMCGEIVTFFEGEFNVWNNERHQLDESERGLHSVTTLKVDSKGSDMYTGNSLGYIQVMWEDNI